MRERPVEIKVPNKALDPLASIVLQRWNEAVRWRQIEQLGNKSLEQIMNECYEQRYGIVAACDRKLIEALGVNVMVNLSDLKVSTLIAWLRDLLTNNGLPFTLTPSPIPELSQRGRIAVLNQVKQQLFSGSMQGDLLSTIRQAKFQQQQQETIYAQQASDNMMKLIEEQCDVGDFRGGLLKMIDDFATYPFAVMHGPFPIMKPSLIWSGNKLTVKNELQFQFSPVSVWDFYWSPDSPDTQMGQGVFIRERITRQQLYQCMNMKSYISDNVLKVIAEINTGIQTADWLSRNPEQPSPFYESMMDTQSSTIEVLHHYGYFSGKELRPYGISDVEDNQFYNASISVIGQYTIQAYINPNPSVDLRPVYATSFESSVDRIAGVSICQKVRDVERAYHTMLRFLLVNAGFAAGPIGEADYSRLQKYMTPEDIGNFTPMTMYLTESDVIGGGRPAFNMHNVPANVGAFINVAEYFDNYADRVTQLPASLHGEPVGTGANRTFRGVTLLQGNAMKPIQSALSNMDKDVFTLLATILYNYNMMYYDDDSVKGDAKIVARGATGLMQKEVAKQDALDTLQLVVTAGPALQNPAIMDWAVMNAFRATGIPVDDLPPAPQPQPPQQAVSQGGAAQPAEQPQPMAQNPQQNLGG